MLLFNIAFGIIWKIFPSLFIMLSAAVAFERVNKEQAKVHKLGKKLIDGQKQQYYRPIFSIPFGLFLFAFSLMLSWLSELRIVNILLSLVLYLLSLAAEISMIIAKKKWGVYENGIFTKRTISFYSEIPEIKIINSTSLEVLNNDGSRESIFIDSNTINWFRQNFPFDRNDVWFNEKWKKG